MSAMTARPTSRIGRPSKGERKTRYSRIPVAIDGLVEAESRKSGLPISDVIANAVAQYFGQEPVAVPLADNDQMQMTA